MKLLRTIFCVLLCKKKSVKNIFQKCHGCRDGSAKTLAQKLSVARAQCRQDKLHKDYTGLHLSLVHIAVPSNHIT